MRDTELFFSLPCLYFYSPQHKKLKVLLLWFRSCCVCTGSAGQVRIDRSNVRRKNQFICEPGGCRMGVRAGVCGKSPSPRAEGLKHGVAGIIVLPYTSLGCASGDGVLALHG